MPRKSKVLRLEQTQNLHRLFEEAGMENDYRARFVRDMKSRLERDRGLSPRMRKWLDDLIEEGIPEVKGDHIMLAKLEAARDLHGMQDDQKILNEFMLKVRNGWDLSEKQTAWATRLLEKAEDIRNNGLWSPDTDQMKKLQACARLGMMYSGTYWSTHQRTYHAWEHIRTYLSQLESAPEHVLVSEYKVGIVLKQFKTKLIELFEKPRFVAGDIAFDRLMKKAGLVCGEPMVDGAGRIVYAILIDDECQEIPTDRLRKRKPK